MPAKELSSIIWKYRNARRSEEDVFHDSILELVNYLVERNGGDTLNNLIHMVRCALGDEYRYREGILSKEEEDILSENYREVVEMACAPTEYDITHRAEAIQPKEITEYVAGFFQPEKRIEKTLYGDSYCTGSFYNPFWGYGSYPLSLPEYEFTGEELNKQTWALAVARFHANGRCDHFPACADSMARDEKEVYDGIITTPPFGMRGELAIEKLIDTYYGRLKEKGVLVMVVPANFLFSNNKSVQEVRLKLILNKAISQVTLFPAGIYLDSSIATAMVVITKEPNTSATFTDASNAFVTKPDVAKKRIFSQELLKEQIAAQTEDELVSITVDYEKVLDLMSIYPPRFLAPIMFTSACRLEDVCEITALAQFPDGAKNAAYFSPANLTPEFARTPVKVDNLERKDIKPGRYYYVDYPAVLFDYNPQTDITRVAYTTADISEGIIVSQAVSVLDTRNSRVSENYLMLVLSDKRVKRQLKERVLGSFIQRIKASDLSTVQIPTMSAEEEDKLVIEVLNASMSETEREAKDAFSKYKKEVRIRKHALSQTISSLSALWNSLEGFRESNGTISGTDTIGRANPTSVNDICNKISGLMNTIISQTERIADVEFDWGKPEWLDFLSTIPRIARKYENPSYTIAFGGSYDSQMIERMQKFQKENGEIDVNEWFKSEEQFDKHLKDCVEFPVKALERIILNIVSNATAYGFTDTTRKDYRIFYDWYEEDGNIVLAISNNGTPLKNDANADMVLSYGYSTNLNESGHSGIGGHEIASIMEQFGGKAEFISTPDEEYTVTYKLTFTKCSEFMPEDEED